MSSRVRFILLKNQEKADFLLENASNQARPARPPQHTEADIRSIQVCRDDIGGAAGKKVALRHFCIRIRPSSSGAALSFTWYPIFR